VPRKAREASGGVGGYNIYVELLFFSLGSLAALVVMAVFVVVSDIVQARRRARRVMFEEESPSGKETKRMSPHQKRRYILKSWRRR
jgi:hypothetical protein